MPEKNDDAVKKLKMACDEAFQDKKASTSCSNAVVYVLNKIIDAEFAWRNANDLIDFLNNQSSKWYPVNLDKAYELANKGVAVIGGAKAQPNGHVIVVYPGNKKPAGGYSFMRSGKAVKIATRGSYPLALSTSMGSWPGAKSKGDKTVWDPWGSDTTFSEVKFWAPLSSK